MASKKTSRGVYLPTEKWEAIDKKAELLGYNSNQFIEDCVDAIFEMMNTSGKRTVPRLVHISDAVKKALNIPVHLDDNVAQHKEDVKGVEKNFVSESDEGTAIA